MADLPQTPMEALERLRDLSSPDMNEQVKAFLRMEGRDRMEFIFRSLIAVHVQQDRVLSTLEEFVLQRKQILEAIDALSQRLPPTH